jgi:hypothetical protein
MLTREQILSSQDRKIQKVTVPEWGGDVYVRSLSGAERDQFEEGNLIREKDRKRGFVSLDIRIQDAKTRLVALSVCDEAGTRLFSDADVEALSKKNSAAIARLSGVASALSGITDENLEDLLKN